MNFESFTPPVEPEATQESVLTPEEFKSLFARVNKPTEGAAAIRENSARLVAAIEAGSADFNIVEFLITTASISAQKALINRTVVLIEQGKFDGDLSPFKRREQGFPGQFMSILTAANKRQPR